MLNVNIVDSYFKKDNQHSIKLNSGTDGGQMEIAKYRTTASSPQLQEAMEKYFLKIIELKIIKMPRLPLHLTVVKL